MYGLPFKFEAMRDGTMYFKLQDSTPNLRFLIQDLLAIAQNHYARVDLDQMAPYGRKVKWEADLNDDEDEDEDEDGENSLPLSRPIHPSEIHTQEVSTLAQVDHVPACDTRSQPPTYDDLLDLTDAASVVSSAPISVGKNSASTATAMTNTDPRALDTHNRMLGAFDTVLNGVEEEGARLRHEEPKLHLADTQLIRRDRPGLFFR